MKIYHLNNILIWLEYHKPTTESNNEENEENKETDSDADCAEWKIQLVMQNSCISTTILNKLEPYIQQVN